MKNNKNNLIASKNKQWEENYAELVKYKKEHGNVLVEYPKVGDKDFERKKALHLDGFTEVSF